MSKAGKKFIEGMRDVAAYKAGARAGYRIHDSAETIEDDTSHGAGAKPIGRQGSKKKNPSPLGRLRRSDKPRPTRAAGWGKK